MENLVALIAPLAVTTLVPLGVGIFLKVMPKKKIMDMTTPASNKFGMVLSKLLLLKLGKKAAESVEEGIFVTLTTVIWANIDAFMKGMLSDNDPKTIEKR
jgi:hypothetical protein